MLLEAANPLDPNSVEGLAAGWLNEVANRMKVMPSDDMHPANGYHQATRARRAEAPRKRVPRALQKCRWAIRASVV